MNTLTRGAMAVLVVLLAAAPALSDSIEMGSLPLNNVKISKIEGNEIFFTTANGTDEHKVIGDNMRLNITDEPVLSEAESSFALKKWDDAAGAYQKVLDSTSKDWLKDYAIIRLQICSEKTGRFDLAIHAWISLVNKNPANARTKPAPPADANSPLIAEAEKELEHNAASATGEVRQAMLVFEKELARKQNDTALILHINKELVEAGGLTSATTLSLTQDFLEAQKYPDAKQLLATLKGPLADAALESQRLFDLAEVAFNTAPANASESYYKDLALDYMRLVANNSANNSASALVAASLLRVAACHEKFNDRDTAIQIYKQITTNYKNSAGLEGVVKQADQNLHRLEGS